MAYLNTKSATHNVILERAHALMKTVVTWQKKRRAYRETYAELSKLNNRDLADIGLSRGDIRRVALESADLLEN